MVLKARSGGVTVQAKTVRAKVAGNLVVAQKFNYRVGGAWQVHYKDEVVVVLANATNVILKNLFSSDEWNDQYLKKRVVIPAGVQIGGTTNSYALLSSVPADGQAGSWAGQLTVDNQGIISGIGGAANSGVGGNAVNGNLPGKDGQKLILNNTGTLRAGGGGGGLGGAGGPGWYNQAYTQVEGPQFTWSSHYIHAYAGGTQFTWPGAPIPLQGDGVTSYYRPEDGWTYYRDAYWGYNEFGGPYYYIRRERPSTYVQPTTGGAGGAGGRGQGYDAANASGVGGSAGGTNAGAGGTGGTGGGWGASGNTGATGAAGNSGAGVGGTAGGLAGYYLTGSSNVTLNNTGTVQGRLL